MAGDRPPAGQGPLRARCYPFGQGCPEAIRRTREGHSKGACCLAGASLKQLTTRRASSPRGNSGLLASVGRVRLSDRSAVEGSRSVIAPLASAAQDCALTPACRHGHCIVSPALTVMVVAHRNPNYPSRHSPHQVDGKFTFGRVSGGKSHGAHLQYQAR